MEKYARQALAEGVKVASDLIVTTDSELYRVLVLHYNRNNQLEVNTSALSGVIVTHFSSCSSAKQTVRGL